MFGVVGAAARLHVDSFVNLLGEDEHGWALSHKGTLWHRGRSAIDAYHSHCTNNDLYKNFFLPIYNCLFKFV